MGLLHYWKFNGNCNDSLNIPSVVNQYTRGGYTGVDLIIQPEQLQAIPPPNTYVSATKYVQLSKEITTVTFPNGKLGTYLKWDGSNDCAAFATLDAALRYQSGSGYKPLIEFNPLPNQRAWVTCWVKYDGTVRPGFKIGELDVKINTTTNKFRVNNTDFGPAIAPERWYFIAIYYDSNNRSIVTASVNDDSATSAAVPIADNYYGSGYSTLYCYDGLDDLRFYDSYNDGTLLSISQIYNLGNPSELSDRINSNRWTKPARHYKFNNSVNDAIAPNNDANSKAKVGSGVTYQNGVVGEAIKVGQVNSWGNLSRSANYSVDLPPWDNYTKTVDGTTTAFWVSLGRIKISPAPGSSFIPEDQFDETIFSGIFGNLKFKFGYGYIIEATNIYMTKPVGQMNVGVPPISVYPKFDHFAVVYSKRYGRSVLYVNGVARAETICGQDGSAYNAYLTLASERIGNDFQASAYFDDLRIYNGELTSEDINSVYGGGLGTESTATSKALVFKTLANLKIPTLINHSMQRAVIGKIIKIQSASLNKLGTFNKTFKTNAYAQPGRDHTINASFIKMQSLNHSTRPIVIKEFNKTLSLNAYLVYTRFYDHSLNSAFLASLEKTSDTTISILGELKKIQSTGLKTYTARDHAGSSYFYLPHYIDTESYFISFKTTGKAKFTNPKDLPIPPTKFKAPFIITKPNSLPTFPKNPSDADQVIDNFGNRWFFDSASSAWISKGDSKQPEVADDTTNGIITPDISDKLQYLRDYGRLPNYFKLAPTNEAYYYYLRSSDKMVKFSPESPEKVRMEIDTGRLFSVLYRQICPGLKGEIGDAGPRGIDNINSLKELNFLPSTSGSFVEFKGFLHAPLKKDSLFDLVNNHVPLISIRLYAIEETGHINDPLFYQKNYLPRYFINDDINLPFVYKFLTYVQKQELGLVDDNIPVSEILNPATETIIGEILAEIRVDPNGAFKNELVYINESIGLNIEDTINSFYYDDVNCVVAGRFIFTVVKDPYTYAVKAMQMGIDGIKGQKGISCIEISELVLSDQNIVATNPIINVRLDINTKTFYSFNANLQDSSVQTLSNNLCATYINLIAGNDILNDRRAFESTYVSVETTLKRCKTITSYAPKLKPYTDLELDLMNWYPTGELSSRKNFSLSNFNWYDTAQAIPADCTTSGKSALAVVGMLASAPTSTECCQEPFFYMPGVQDGPCGEAAVPPPAMPLPTPTPLPPPTTPTTTPTTPTTTPTTPTTPTTTPTTPTTTPTTPTTAPTTPTTAPVTPISPPPPIEYPGCDPITKLCNLVPTKIAAPVGNEIAAKPGSPIYLYQPGTGDYFPKSSGFTNCLSLKYPEGLTKNAALFVQAMKNLIPSSVVTIENLIIGAKTRKILSTDNAIIDQLRPYFPKISRVEYGDRVNKLPDGCPGYSRPGDTGTANGNYLRLENLKAYTYVDYTLTEYGSCGGYTIDIRRGIHVEFVNRWVINYVWTKGWAWDLSATSAEDKLINKANDTDYTQIVEFEEPGNTYSTTNINLKFNDKGQQISSGGCPTGGSLTLKGATWTFATRGSVSPTTPTTAPTTSPTTAPTTSPTTTPTFTPYDFIDKITLAVRFNPIASDLMTAFTYVTGVNGGPTAAIKDKTDLKLVSTPTLQVIGTGSSAYAKTTAIYKHLTEQYYGVTTDAYIQVSYNTLDNGFIISQYSGSVNTPWPNNRSYIKRITSEQLNARLFIVTQLKNSLFAAGSTNFAKKNTTGSLSFGGVVDPPLNQRPPTWRSDNNVLVKVGNDYNNPTGTGEKSQDDRITIAWGDEIIIDDGPPIVL